MTRIGEEYILGSINVKTYFHLPISRVKDNCFLVNDGRNSVVKVQDRKLLHSWTLTHPNSFTCPVAFDENEIVYGIMNCNTLLRWSLNDDNLKSAEKLKFPESVFAVLPICGQQPIVLFSTGKILQTEKLPSKELIGQSFVKKTEEMVWADATMYQSKIVIVCLSVSKKVKSYKLHSFTLSENNVTDYFSQPIVHESNTLRSWCFNKSSASFYTIWSNGLILNHLIATSDQSTVITVPDVQESHLLAIDSIDSNHVALVKCNPVQKETTLEIWDIQFSILKAKKSLKGTSPSAIQLLATDSIIFLSYNEELIELSFQVEKSTLAAAVGKSSTSVSQTKEFSWKNGKLNQVTSVEPVSEKMDTSETISNPTELMAQRLMEEGPTYLKYIPESELVSLLRLAIRYKFKEKSKNNIEPDIILTAIFSSSFNDVILMKFMKILNLEEAMVTLETLLSLLKNKSTFSCASSMKPSDLQLFNWICLVIQSHMDSLLLSKDKKCIKLMKKLDKCLSEKMAEYEDYESIQNIFFTIHKKKNILPERYVDSRYCIETLDT